ncbi:phosphoribosylanthranilate isomerase [Dechloromonas denitrificans]|uniref:phosphoribosylanthranilate isomerase n=1 Tax=Dechloromonas denitrificans TaxID=281362 RepID=UPI001CF7FC88|nr:phosphoribosylanthranilate isomerase [Dechloromonas denitrificans]UCV02859.1 phosphoribosylanthranilate isomerase [Dechloromonas denitrificans]UCV07167.1 phosphoribosylanthranilate isomerase [Dechloromonas denitrificans]
MKTRIKICGLTRAEDVDAAVAAGADALGFVFYPPSPRYVTPQQAAELVKRIPPFVDVVGLFVNETAETVRSVCRQVPISLLQFHGDEDPAYCRQFAQPYLRAARVRPGLDLVEFSGSFPESRGLLLDAFVEGYGGGGHVFDWTLIPSGLPGFLVLSGGLTAENVGDAVRRVHPAAVDVSSGVEMGKGIKDHAKIAAFVAAVRAADVAVNEG